MKTTSVTATQNTAVNACKVHFTGALHSAALNHNTSHKASKAITVVVFTQQQHNLLFWPYSCLLLDFVFFRVGKSSCLRLVCELCSSTLGRYLSGTVLVFFLPLQLLQLQQVICWQCLYSMLIVKFGWIGCFLILLYQILEWLIWPYHFFPHLCRPVPGWFLHHLYLFMFMQPSNNISLYVIVDGLFLLTVWSRPAFSLHIVPMHHAHQMCTADHKF